MGILDGFDERLCVTIMDGVVNRKSLTGSERLLVKLITFWRPSAGQIELKHGAPCAVPEEVVEILLFWFGGHLRGVAGQSDADRVWRDIWFAKNEAQVKLDAAMDDAWEQLVRSALRGECDHWTATVWGALALIVVLDQFTRNIFRGTRDAWCGDAKALSVCLDCLENHAAHVQRMPAFMRLQLYMPLLHAEDATLQRRSVALYEENLACGPSALSSVLEWGVRIARLHKEAIDRDGRFAERNTLLGRVTTAAEKAFLDGTVGGDLRYKDAFAKPSLW